MAGKVIQGRWIEVILEMLQLAPPLSEEALVYVGDGKTQEPITQQMADERRVGRPPTTESSFLRDSIRPWLGTSSDGWIEEHGSEEFKFASKYKDTELAPIGTVPYWHTSQCAMHIGCSSRYYCWYIKRTHKSFVDVVMSWKQSREWYLTNGRTIDTFYDNYICWFYDKESEDDSIELKQRRIDAKKEVASVLRSPPQSLPEDQIDNLLSRKAPREIQCDPITRKAAYPEEYTLIPKGGLVDEKQQQQQDQEQEQEQQ